MLKRLLILALLLVAAPAAAQVLPVTPSSISANNTTACVDVDRSTAAVTFVLSGTWTGVVEPRVRFDISGVTDVTPPTSLVSAASTAANGTLSIVNYGFRRACVRTTTLSSGTVNLTAVSGGSEFASAMLIAAQAANDVAAGTADTGFPVKIGCKALGLGVDPTGVAANARQNIICTTDGQIFIIGGHPNAITRACRVADSDNAQTGQACVTVSAGTRIAVTRALVTCSAANTVNVAVRVMFDTDTTFASSSTTGVAGEIFAHDGVYPGGGVGTGDGSGIIGIGADDEDVRYTMADPVTGACTLSVTYFTIQG